MLNAYDLGMISSEYAFFSAVTLPESCRSKDKAGQLRDDDACRAFEGLKIIHMDSPNTAEYRAFKDDVRRRMPEFQSFGYQMKPSDEVR